MDEGLQQDVSGTSSPSTQPTTTGEDDPSNDTKESNNSAQEVSGDKKDKNAAIMGTLPLVLGPKCDQTATFAMSTDVADLDLSGDVGHVGRLYVDANRKPNKTLTMDIKGLLLEGGAVDCNSLLVVNIGKSEATVDAVINTMLNLEHKSSVRDSEQLIKGSYGLGLENREANKDNDERADGEAKSEPDQHQLKKRKTLSSSELALKSSKAKATVKVARKKVARGKTKTAKSRK